uniref:Uncharacterized protein n=1 Tax=Chromera velia CCMP2878 TaxID=1169474 RepID=A0A0G4GTL9_9ALVE|eukprot:Cvel_5168.t1-p1 / transcript=Cvel_5168.t1 / gene=Cvel_5168 / organism=Chromera_velia_CCMP2878 / gene_product=hypothetical protein / transcript_product=hypothetical protein / location=Cvel_scaffold237:41877-43890(-) / protein_length=334 / sequence_SO=supercontig / SO=protein_coding / is_pseudo=false
MPQVDWAMQASADTVVVNRTMRLEPFLAEADHEGVDVILSKRITDPTRNRVEGFTNYHRRNRKAGKGKRFVAHPAMLHTEIILVKNSEGGRRWAETLLKTPELFNDMGSIMEATFEEIEMPPEDRSLFKEVFVNMTTGKGAFFDYLGDPGPWVASGLPFKDLNVHAWAYYDFTLRYLLRKRVWPMKKGGAIQILDDGELVRDWNSGLLMRNGDFILHTKRVNNNIIEDKKPMTPPFFPHPAYISCEDTPENLAADPLPFYANGSWTEALEMRARVFGYCPEDLDPGAFETALMYISNVTRTFHKAGIFQRYDCANNTLSDASLSAGNWTSTTVS